LLENTKLQSSMSWLVRSIIFIALWTSLTSMPCWLADLMMQFLTYFWRFRQCHLNFMPFASSLHATAAFSRATLSASDRFAASAGVGTNATPLSTAAIMPAVKARRYRRAQLHNLRRLSVASEGAVTMLG